MSPLFDTLRATRRLQEYGYSERQAEGVVVVLEEALQESVATKADLDALEQRIKRWTLRLALVCMGVGASVVLTGVGLMLKFMGG